MRFLKFVGKMVLKLVALPVLFVLGLICLLAKLVVNVSSFAIGALILYILGCCIYCVFQSLWLQLGLSDTIKANEKRMVEIGALQTHINNYSRTRSVYEAYRKSGYSIKFFEEHREEIQIHKAAKKAFDQLPGKKVPTRQSLNEEYHRLLSGKKEAYAEYRQVKKDMQEYLIAKQTVEHILGIDRKNRIITQQQNLD